MYSSKGSFVRSIHRNTKCGHCAHVGMTGKKHSEESKRKTSESLKGKNSPNYGKSHSAEHRRNLSISMKGRIFSAEHRRNLRLARIADVKKKYGQLSPNYNPEACKLIEEYGRTNGYNFQHAENGGEFHIKSLGYWVDGYDKKQNVVIEIYESHHKRQIEKDACRQKEIEEYLGCQFIVMWIN